MRTLSKYSEEELIAEIEKVVKTVAPSFVCGYYTLEDIESEATIEAIKCLDRYDETRPLPNFLYSHIKKRLTNFRRDHYYRAEAPCNLCRKKEDGETLHFDKKHCTRHKSWVGRNTRKQLLMNSARRAVICDDDVMDVLSFAKQSDNFEDKEIFQLVDEKLSAYLREPYLRLMDKAKINPALKVSLLKELREILCHYIAVDD